jgi:hypothetical protein
MMRAMLGSTIGGLVAGVVALVAATQLGRAPENAMASAQPMTMANAAGPVVECAPYQDATMQRVIVNGREATALTCVNRVDDRVAYYPAQPAYAQAYAQPVYAPAPVARPAVQRSTAVRERVVYQDREPDVRTNRRSWGKTALIIGGGSGAGAGIGALAGGKKGALIGAAIGGGAASIFEATKR